MLVVAHGGCSGLDGGMCRHEVKRHGIVCDTSPRLLKRKLDNGRGADLRVRVVGFALSEGGFAFGNGDCSHVFGRSSSVGSGFVHESVGGVGLSGRGQYFVLFKGDVVARGELTGRLAGFVPEVFAHLKQRGEGRGKKGKHDESEQSQRSKCTRINVQGTTLAMKTKCRCV